MMKALIEELIRHNKALIELLEASESEPVKSNKPKVEPVKLVTHDDLRNLFQEIMRADKDRKGELKALLNKYGADRTSEVKDEDLNAIYAEAKG